MSHSPTSDLLKLVNAFAGSAIVAHSRSSQNEIVAASKPSHGQTTNPLYAG